ncbi:HlyD family secretion protein [Enterobacter sp.]|uniref:HlyD family secretion protein n=1 Tax=Enterobacter sp. TaxID=42895 RepID=UPI00296EEB62|nr:HlyD family secretion protein [Enterobacter sp.]
MSEKLSVTRPRTGRAVTVLLLTLIALSITVYAIWMWHSTRFLQSTDDAYVGSDISTVSTKVSGFISEIAIRDNATVKKGELLIRLDDRDYRAALVKAQGEEAAQEAMLTDIAANRQLQLAKISGASASFSAAQAQTSKTAGDNRRYSMLASSAAISQQVRANAQADYQKAQAEERKAWADHQAAQRQLAVLDAREQQARAALTQVRASTELARLNLSYTEIRAPFDGVVGNRHAWVGAYVTGGTHLLSLVPAQGLWIDANFKEDQLAHMQPGQPATVAADILPDRHFHGHVVSLAPATGSRFSLLPAENATGNFTKIVQRVPVRIALDGNDDRLGVLRPGLSVTVTVDEKGAK